MFTVTRPTLSKKTPTVNFFPHFQKKIFTKQKKKKKLLKRQKYKDFTSNR